MQLQKAKLPVATHSFLITALVQTNQPIEFIIQVVRHMQQQDPQPNNVAPYYFLINTYAALCQPVKAAAVVRAMQQQGQLPSVVTYNFLIRTLQPQQAIEVIKDMRQHGVPPNSVTYNAMINVIAAAGQQQEQAKEVIRLMQQHFN